MKRLSSLVTAALLVTAVAACRDPAAPVGPGPRDAAAYDEAEATTPELDGASDDCAIACVNVRHHQCRTGFSVAGGSSCSAVCRHIRDSRITQLEITCAIKAPTPAALHACAGWGC